MVSVLEFQGERQHFHFIRSLLHCTVVLCDVLALEFTVPKLPRVLFSIDSYALLLFHIISPCLSCSIPHMSVCLSLHNINYSN